MPDLIDLNRARQNIPSSTNSDEPTIATLITAVSKAVQRWCRRDFVSTAYDELYDGNGDDRLMLRQYPIINVESVRSSPTAVLRITNTQTSNQQARVSLTSTGLTLVRIASAVNTTNVVYFSTNKTLSAVKSAVDAFGSGGWSASVVGNYGLWPSADLLPIQGALNAAGVQAELMMHVDILSAFEIDSRHGFLLRSSDGSSLQPQTSSLIWPAGVSNFRVKYTAGYVTVPEDVQEATAEWVATLFKDLGRNQNVMREDQAGVYSSTALEELAGKPPPAIRALLASYRNHRV